MDLFITPETKFEKTAAQTALPEDPNAWPHEVLQELYKQAPYISDFSPHVEMEKVDGERGYGLGHIEIGNQTEMPQGTSPEQQAAAGVRVVRVPVIIKDGMLEPFDLLVTDDSKVQPLTEPRLRAAIFRPQAFDVTSRTPGDQSMVGQLYPPFRQSYGFGGGVGVNVGMGKEGSALEDFLMEKDASFQSEAAQFTSTEYLHAKEGMKQGRYGKKVASGDARLGMLDEFISKHASAAPEMVKKGSVLAAVAPTISASDRHSFQLQMVDRDTQMLLHKNAASIAPSLSTIFETPQMPKMASIAASIVGHLSPPVVQVRRADEGYRVKTAHPACWGPESRFLTRSEAVQEFGEKVVLAADLNGAVTMADEEGMVDEGAEESELDSDMQSAGPITEPGLYKVQAGDGQEAIGYAFPNLIGPEGRELPLTLFTNGTQAAVQTDLVGIPVEGEGVELPSADSVTKNGFFACETPEGLKATVPFTIQGSVGGMEGEPGSFAATAFSGEDVQLSVQPNIETVIASEEGLLIPEHWTWVPLDQAGEIVLASSEEDMPKEGSMQRSLATVELRGSGTGTWSVSGPSVDKLAHAEREMLGVDDAMLLLAGLGVKSDYGVRKLAQASSGMEPVRVRVGRSVKLASDQVRAAYLEAAEVLESMPYLKQDHLLKEAATISDPMAVDSVLSLGFINPENIMTFVSYMPVLEDAQLKLCDILMASRLGALIETPDGAIERCVRSMESVLEGLKALAFRTN